MTKVDETFLSAFKERVAAQEISRFWQLELEEVGPGRAKVSMVCRPKMANILGMVARLGHLRPGGRGLPGGGERPRHGGGGPQHEPHLPRRGQDGGAPHRRTRELHAGRRTATYFIEVTDPKGTLIASCQALAYRKDTPLEFGKL